MTINNKDLFLEGVWDWAMFDGCFGRTNIKPTDIDGFVERKGRFLVLEAKSPSAPIPEGQMIGFKALASTGYFSILIMWGEKNKPEKALLITRKGEFLQKVADRNRCRQIVAAWFAYVEAFS